MRKGLARWRVAAATLAAAAELDAALESSQADARAAAAKSDAAKREALSLGFFFSRTNDALREEAEEARAGQARALLLLAAASRLRSVGLSAIHAWSAAAEAAAVAEVAGDALEDKERAGHVQVRRRLPVLAAVCRF